MCPPHVPHAHGSPRGPRALRGDAASRRRTCTAPPFGPATCANRVACDLPLPMTMYGHATHGHWTHMIGMCYGHDMTSISGTHRPYIHPCHHAHTVHSPMARLLIQPWHDRIPCDPAPLSAFDPCSGDMGGLENSGDAPHKLRSGAPAPDPAPICVSLPALACPRIGRARVCVFGRVHPVSGSFVVYNTPGE